MRPVNATARLARVAVVPGSPEGEAWGIGFSFARMPRFNQFLYQGQPVMMRYTDATGWQVTGAPLTEDGQPESGTMNALALASTGEGWAIGGSGAIYHRLPGGPFKRDPQASAVTPNNLNALVIGEDDQGVFGFAVGDNLTILRLQDGVWSLDSAGGLLSGQTAPRLAAIATTSREEAWAVSSRSDALEIYRRTAAGWSRQLTGDPIFDSPPAPPEGSQGTGTINQYSSGTGIAATRDAVWITGKLQPVDVARSAEQDLAPRKDRPFAIRYDPASDTAGQDPFTSYCPKVYRLSNSGVSSTVDICDRPFPLTIGDLPVVAAFPGGRALVGGSGFFSFSNGKWERERNVAGYLVSGSFRSFSDGWVASSGDVLSVEGSATSSTITLGRWSAADRPGFIRRWAIPTTAPLESVALEPQGKRAIAVGKEGTIVSSEPAAGWDLVPSPTKLDLHSVAWPSSEAAHAVGEDGTILRAAKGAWSADPASQRATTSDLYSVAFSSPAAGWAVGDKGTILAYSNGSWSKDPASGTITKSKLNAVTIAGEEVVAVGDKGTVLVRTGAGWRVVEAIAKKLEYGTQAPRATSNLLSAAGLPDGSAFIGGSQSSLVSRKPGGDFEVGVLPALEGAVHTIAAAKDPTGGLVLLAAVGRSGSRFGESGLIDPSGWLFKGDGRGWIDIGQGRAASLDAVFDSPAQRDAVYAAALAPGGRTGWLVGGYPKDLLDDDGHTPSSSSSSVWALDLSGKAPPSPSETKAWFDAPRDGVSFAFIGDSACATALCGPVAGTGTRGDVILTAALRQMRELTDEARLKFVMFGGDMRRNGIPDEIEPVRDAIRAAGLPAYAAVGDKDLFRGLTAGLLPALGDDSGVLPSSGYFLSSLSAAPAPFGEGRPPAGIRPVPAPGDADARPGQARSHYAFDIDTASGRARVIVLDTSVVPLASSIQNQNPQRDQVAWLSSVIRTDRPVVVVMHRPMVVPIATDLDSAALTSILSGAGVKAVVSSHERLNRIAASPSEAAPLFKIGIFGGGGSPLEGAARLEDGAYHSWQVVTVTEEGAEFRSIPVLESVAISAPTGRSAGAGSTLRFSGLGRAPDAGAAHSSGPELDPSQSRATYLRFPLPRRCGFLEGTSSCMRADTAAPEHRFLCEDPQVCTFVREDPSSPGRPLRDPLGRLISDPASGLMCAFTAGDTHVRLEAGFVAARIPVSVSGGSGPCIPGIVVAPGRDTATAEGSLEAEPTPERDFRPHVSGRLPESAAVAAVPPPIVNPAPAPPGGGGAQREEEHESATERSQMTGLVLGRDAGSAVSVGMAAALIGLATVLALVIKRRPRYEPARVLLPTSRKADRR